MAVKDELPIANQLLHRLLPWLVSGALSKWRAHNCQGHKEAASDTSETRLVIFLVADSVFTSLSRCSVMIECCHERPKR